MTQAEAVTMLVARIRPILADLSPQLQGATLADLLAIWLAGHPEPLRGEVLRMHLEMVDMLVPINERIMRRERMQ